MADATDCNETQHAGDKIDRAVGAVLACPRVEDAARRLGVDRSTLWRMSQDPEFRRRLREARARLNKEVVAALQANMLEAVQTLRDVMTDKQAPASARVSAATKIIELGLKAREQLELQGRLAALELALKLRGAEKKATRAESK